MPIIKEVREFFLRHTKVLTGVKRDREQPYPLQYTTTNALGELVTAYNRFLAGDIPSEDTFKKFLESITFKLNPEDTAKTTEQGLVMTATAAEVLSRLYVASNDFQKVVKVEHIPEVYYGGDIILNIKYKDASNPSDLTLYSSTGAVPSGNYRQVYVITYSTPQFYEYTAMLNLLDAAPIEVFESTNNFGVVVWSKTSNGIYDGVCTGAFPVGTVIVTNTVTDANHFVKAFRYDDNTIRVSTVNNMGIPTAADIYELNILIRKSTV